MKQYLTVLFVGVFFAPLFSYANTDLTQARGVSLPSFEWACVQYDQVYDFPLENTIQALQNWNIDTVRLPLNQDCWLDDPAYQSAVDEVIDRFGATGFDVIIDLHWNAPTGASGIEQQVMADAERSPEFWRQMARLYKDHNAVVGYELYNEPHTVSWECWRDGCTSPEGWQTAGMQDLVDAVRSVDQETWVIVNGLDWANNVQGAIANAPYDPADKMAFGWHVYDEFDDPNKCVTQDCFETEIKPLAEQHDIIITEFGSRLFCNPEHDQMIIDFASQNSVGMVAWAWYPADCGFPALIKDWSGTPTPAGARWCSFLQGDCYAGVVQGATDEPKTVSTEPSTPPEPASVPAPAVTASQPLCIVSLEHGVLNNQNTLCSSGYELSITGSSEQTWNNRISSWTAEGEWLAIAGWDYYTTSGRVEKGIELWTANQAANVAANVNDRVHYILFFPDTNGSLTVYENIDSDGPYLSFSVSQSQ